MTPTEAVIEAFHGVSTAAGELMEIINKQNARRKKTGEASAARERIARIAERLYAQLLSQPRRETLGREEDLAKQAVSFALKLEEALPKLEDTSEADAAEMQDAMAQAVKVMEALGPMYEALGAVKRAARDGTDGVPQVHSELQELHHLSVRPLRDADFQHVVPLSLAVKAGIPNAAAGLMVMVTTEDGPALGIVVDDDAPPASGTKGSP